MSKAPWVPHSKGAPDQPAFEITIIRQDFDHGLRSFGWFGENKLLVSSSGGPSRTPVCRPVWDKLIRVATEIAKELNAAEPIEGFVAQRVIGPSSS